MNFSSQAEIYNPNPKISIIEKIIYTPGIIFATLNIVTCTIFAILSIEDRKRFHHNFFILRIHLIIAFYLIAITHIFILLINFIEGTAVPTRFYDFWYVNVIVGGGFATEVLRYLWISIVIERCFATFYSDIYEGKSFRWLPILLTIFSYGLAIICAYLRFYVVISEAIMSSWNLLFDFIGVSSIYVLRRINKSRRAIKSNSNIKLTQRYQIVENIRILKIIFPIIVTGICFSTFGTFIFVTTTQIENLRFLFRYAIYLFYVSFNAYELIALIIWLRKDPVYNKRLRSFFNKFIQPKTRDHSININLFVLTNVEGKAVLMEQNAITHFHSLDLFWK